MEVQFKEWPCKIVLGMYGNKRVAMQLIHAVSGLPVAKATINIPEAELGNGEAFIKDYSDNEGMKKMLTDAGAITPLGTWWHSGWIDVERVRINVDLL